MLKDNDFVNNTPEWATRKEGPPTKGSNMSGWVVGAIGLSVLISTTITDLTHIYGSIDK